MEYKEAKQKFIDQWGILGSSWGINRTMAQIHALLLLAPDPLSTEEIMEELKISRGNANMNTRALIDWGIVHKSFKAGERKEFFYAGKDLWEMARKIIKQRRDRELEPVRSVIAELKSGVKGKSKNEKEMKQVIENLDNLTGRLDGVMEKFVKSDENWFYKSLLKAMK